MRRQRDIVSFGQRRDLAQLADAPAVGAIRLQDVDAVVLQVRYHFPDAPIALAGRDRHANLLLETLEDLDGTQNVYSNFEMDEAQVPA